MNSLTGDPPFKKSNMKTIKRILLIFAADTLMMLVSWAGVSLILFCGRAIFTPQAVFAKMLSVYSFFVVMFCYTLYLVFDLCIYITMEIRLKNECSDTR